MAHEGRVFTDQPKRECAALGGWAVVRWRAMDDPEIKRDGITRADGPAHDVMGRAVAVVIGQYRQAIAFIQRLAVEALRLVFSACQV